MYLVAIGGKWLIYAKNVVFRKPGFPKLKFEGDCHNGFSLDLEDHKNKWSRHRSFLYEWDRSPEMHVLKLGTEIPNLKQNDWST